MTRVALFGTGASANEFLRLAEETSGIDVAVVATSSDDPLAAYLSGNSREALLFDRMPKADLFNAVQAIRPDLLFSVTSPFLFNADWLGLPKLGAYNCHPSALPRYAGFYPFVWSIIEGATEHGVTIHRLTPQIDGGGIVAQKVFPILAAETGASLYLKCTRGARELFPNFLKEVADGPLEGRPQDLTQRSYFRRQIPLGGRANFSWEAAAIERAIRAFTFKPFTSQIGELTVGLMTGGRLSLDSAALEEKSGDSWSPGTLIDFDGTDALIGCGNGLIRLRRMGGKVAREALEGVGVLVGQIPFSD
jgi:UDP-4-amino-4-deoxy-L-arabinose formyltransferase/UDP-glucuronic acid dehydrogenase (UDP-4-keto-hexauronic acid decarboxylating)